VADPDFQGQALQHLDALYNFAMYLTKRPPDADDLVQGRTSGPSGSPIGSSREPTSGLGCSKS
jgi:hypothetical protein